MYASLLLHARIGELSDPIFRENGALNVGDSVRIYTRGGNGCVGEGCIVEHGEETWGSTGVFLLPRRATRGVTQRWAVRLEKVHVPRARCLYPDANDPPRTSATAQIGDRLGCVVLWDANRLRKSVATAPATTSGASGASGALGQGGGSGTTSSARTASSLDGSGVSPPLGVTGQGGAGGAGGAFSPSESFFAGQLEGIEALSSQRAAFSSSAGDAGDEGRYGGEAGGADDEEGVIDVTGDMSLEVEDFLQVSIQQLRNRSGDVFIFAKGAPGRQRIPFAALVLTARTLPILCVAA